MKAQSSAYPVIALNEFVAANRTLASSHNRPEGDPQEYFNEGTFLGHTGRWQFAKRLLV